MVLQEGEYADRCYLISRGQVQLLAGAGEGARQSGASPVLIQTLGAGDVLGWSWLFPPFEWHFSAVATEPCDAIELNAAFLLTAAEKDPVFGYELLKRVSMQLVQRLQATRARLAEEAQKRRRGKP